MNPNVEKALNLLLKEEGGIADVGDGMGITRFGQTPDWLTTFGFKAPENKEQAATNYFAWMKLFKFDQILDVNYPLGMALLDFAVNSTERGAIKALQQVLGVSVDGVIGPLSLDAILKCDYQVVGLKLTIKRQRAFANQLSRDPNSRKFAAGWMNRLADIYEEFAY